MVANADTHRVTMWEPYALRRLSAELSVKISSAYENVYTLFTRAREPRVKRYQDAAFAYWKIICAFLILYIYRNPDKFEVIWVESELSEREKNIKRESGDEFYYLFFLLARRISAERHNAERYTYS